MDEKEFPTFFEQVKNVSGLAKDVAKDMIAGKEIFVSEEIRNQRLDLCMNCQYLDGPRCRACGCFVEQKTKLASSHCPVMKWGQVQA